MDDELCFVLLVFELMFAAALVVMVIVSVIMEEREEKRGLGGYR